MRINQGHFFLSVVGLGFFARTLACRHADHKNKKHSFDHVANHYGFTTPSKKEAFNKILRRSLILQENQSLQDKFSFQKTDDEFILCLLTLIQTIQKELMRRSGSQERWEASPASWMENNSTDWVHDLKQLGFVDAIKPTFKTVDAVCVLGATRPKMANRIAYLMSLFKNGLKAETIILLAGERYATKIIDGTEEELSFISQKFNLPTTHWKLLTETHLIQHEFELSNLSKKNLKKYIIDTPAKNGLRPTTQTTIIALLNWLKDHPEIKSILFISNQPYTHYQQAVIQSVFKAHEVYMRFETVGSAADNAKIQTMLEALGSYLFASTPRVLMDMNLTMTDPHLKAQFKQCYLNNPLIYSVLYNLEGNQKEEIDALIFS